MENSITNSYKNKEYGWYVAYITTIIVSFRIAGLIGLITSMLVVAGLYKVIKNSALSKKKKFLLSILFIVCGVVGIIVVVNLFKAGINKYTDYTFINEPAVNQVLNAEPSEPIVVNPVKNIEKNANEYVSQNHNFKINQPMGWTVNENQTNIIVEFDDTTASQFGAITIGSDLNMGSYPEKQYAGGIIQGMAEEGAKNISIIKQGALTLNGNPAYFVEFNYDHIFPDSKYPMHALSVSLIRNGTGYAMLGVTQKETWNLYEKLFWDTMSSFNFLK